MEHAMSCMRGSAAPVANVSRRGFVAGAALAVTTGTLATSSALATGANSPTRESEYDVVVIGLGAAGAAAAIEARAAGASVCVLEKAARGGGSTLRSGGTIYMGGGTALQEELGIEDTPEAMATYVTAAAGPSADPDNLAAYCAASIDLYDWCVAQGMTFTGIADTENHIQGKHDGISLFYSGNERAFEYASIAQPAPRGHTPDGASVGLFEALEANVEATCDVLYETAATALVTNGAGRVVGVEAQGADGTTRKIGAKKGVVICAGAFTYNDMMLADYGADTTYCGGRSGCENDLGDGIIMAQRIGAAARSMSRMNYSQALYLYADLAAGVLLDYRGLRILAEDDYGAWTGRTIIETTPETCLTIVDDEMLQGIHASTFGANLEPVAQADTVEELAAQIGLPVDNVVRSIGRYNELAESGEDTDFHKSAGMLRPIVTPPFSAMDTSSRNCSFHTLGGLKINARAQVIDLVGAPIPGLYAAGRSACGIFGEYPGSGSSIADALTFGRIAGREMAQA